METAFPPDLRRLGLAMALVAASILFVDRPAATFSHFAFHGAGVFRALTHIVDPVLPVAALGLAIAMVAGVLGWRPGPLGRLLLACCVAALVAQAVKDQAKFAFGRLWPETWIDGNPSWIKDGAYGFVPFHGGTGWSAFPSGHMTGITAPVAVLWPLLPRWRVVLALPVVLVAIGLYGADYHFVGDILAGAIVGFTCGTGIGAVLRTGVARRPEASAPP